MKHPAYKIFGRSAAVLVAAFFVLSLFYIEITLYERYMIAVNGVTFLSYGYDKISAIWKGVRIPELVLHILALLGGFLGGWLGMLIFRHKKNTIAIIAVLFLASVLHLAIAAQMYPDFAPPFLVLG